MLPSLPKLKTAISNTFFFLTLFVLVGLASPGIVDAATFELTPATGQGQTFTVQIKLDTANEQIWGLDAILKYDPAKLAIDSASFGSLFDLQTPTINNNTGTTHLIAEFEDTEDTYVGTGILATLTVRGKQAGPAQLQFECQPDSDNDSNIFRFSDDTDVINCAQIINGSYTVVLAGATGAAGTPTPTLRPGTGTPTATPTTSSEFGTVTPAATATPAELPVTAFDKPTWTILIMGVILISMAGWIMNHRPQYH